MKKVQAIFVLILLILSVPGLSVISADSRDAARKGQEQITKFSDGSESALLTFNSGGGSSSALNISVPKRSSVLSASFEVEGRSTPAMSEYNFSDTKNNRAWYGGAKSLPSSEKPQTFENKEFDSKEYNAILLNDTTMADHFINVSPYNISRLYHMFKFNVTEPSPTMFDFYWSGKCYLMNAIGIATDEVYAYIYCPGNSTWVKFYYYYKSGTVGWNRITINRQIDQAGNYVNSTTNAVYIILLGSVIDITIMSSGSIGTDCASLTVYTSSTDYPSGVSVDVGADGNVEWTHPGSFSTRVKIDDGEGLKSALQALIDNAGTDEGEFTIIFKIGSQSSGRVLVDTLNISIETLDHNEPPSIISAGFGHYYLNEDSAETGAGLIDCADYFLDDHDAPIDLKYSIAAVDPPGVLLAVMAGDGHTVDFSPAPDFSGTVMFRINATDSGREEVFDTFDDLTARSNYFNVTVLPVNDAPRINPLAAPLAVNESDTLEFNLSVSDIDDTAFSWSSNLSEKVSITPEPMDSSLAMVTVTHDDGDVGKIMFFQVSVTDSGGGQGTASKLSDNYNCSVEVINRNDAPAFVKFYLVEAEHDEPPVPGHTIKLKNGNGAWEDEYYNITVTVSDPDTGIDPDEKLAYSIVPLSPINGTLGIDSATGAISLFPINEDVGTVEFKVIVSDRAGETAEQVFELQVKNRNDAPRDIKILEPSVLEFYENETVSFKGECDDDDLYIPDSEEYLTFIWTTNRSSQPIGTGEELLNKKLEAGIHEITLRVVDAEGEFVTTAVELKVLAVIDDIDDDDKDDDDKTNGDDDKNQTGDDDRSGDDKGSTLLMAGLAILIVIVVIVVVIFGILRKKRRERRAEEEHAAALQAQQQAALMQMQMQAQMQVPPGMMMPYPSVPGMPQLPVQPGMEFINPALPPQYQQPQQQVFVSPYQQEQQPQFTQPALPEQQQTLEGYTQGDTTTVQPDLPETVTLPEPDMQIKPENEVQADDESVKKN